MAKKTINAYDFITGEFIAAFPSRGAAEKHFELYNGAVGRVLNGKAKSVKGLTFAFDGEEVKTRDTAYKFKAGDIYKNNHGTEFTILERMSDSYMAKIKFLDEVGHEKIINLRDINRDGSAISNPYDVTIAGIGYIGEIENQSSHKMYKTWLNMLHRCYNPDNIDYPSYGAQGVTVSEEFHCFATFAEFMESVPRYEEYGRGSGLEIDKDMLSGENKIYSRETICIVESSFNSSIAKKANAVAIRIIYNNGEVVEFKSITEAAQACGVHVSSFADALSGRITGNGFKQRNNILSIDRV